MLKKFFSWTIIGEIGLFCVYWDYAEWKNFSEVDNNFFIFQISNDPLVFANNSFSKIWYINIYRDGFISQNVKIYLAYTVKKVSGFPAPSRDVTDQTLPGREII